MKTTLKLAALGAITLSMTNLSDGDINKVVEIKPFLNKYDANDFDINNKELAHKTAILKEYQEYKKDRKKYREEFVSLEEFTFVREKLVEPKLKSTVKSNNRVSNSPKLAPKPQ